MNNQYEYSEEFYNNIKKIKLDEEEVIPYVLEKLHPQSVVDFGCGEGNWLAEIKRIDQNVIILGLDGDYIKNDRLAIATNEFKPVDLRQRIELNRKYDLAMSLEVAEHLEEEYADTFVDNITRASDRILFSAAIPGQGGVHHVNEQWQSYWIDRFAKRGYGVDFSFRKQFWNNPNINSWRRQNLLFFSKEIKVNHEYEGVVDVVHPMMLAHFKELIEFETSRAVRYMINNPEAYERIKEVLDRFVDNMLVFIYPYGRNGKLCELLLKYYYNTDQYFLIDNKMWDDGEKLRTLNYVANTKDEYVVLDVCSNPEIHRELLDAADNTIGLNRVITVFDEAF